MMDYDIYISTSIIRQFNAVKSVSEPRLFFLCKILQSKRECVISYTHEINLGNRLLGSVIYSWLKFRWLPLLSWSTQAATPESCSTEPVNWVANYNCKLVASPCYFPKHDGFIFFNETPICTRLLPQPRPCRNPTPLPNLAPCFAHTNLERASFAELRTWK